MRYAWIETQRDCYPLGLLCRVLQVSRSGYTPGACVSLRPAFNGGSRSGRPPSSSPRSDGTYGYRRVHRDLMEDQEIPCCRETVRRVMGEWAWRAGTSDVSSDDRLGPR